MNSGASICHHLFSTDFGDAAVVYRTSPFSVVQVLLPRPNRAALVADATRAGWGCAGSDEQVLALTDRIVRYFEGVPIPLSHKTWQLLDLQGVTGLQRSVLEATAAIPFGQVRSYKEVAETVGRPKAYRFVGSTMAANPFPILIPCHRVLGSDGSLRGFGGGLALKQRMLDLEAGQFQGGVGPATGCQT